MISACGPPVSWVWPSPSKRPSVVAMTQPTEGLGEVSVKPFSARLSALAIKEERIGQVAYCRRRLCPPGVSCGLYLHIATRPRTIQIAQSIATIGTDQ